MRIHLWSSPRNISTALMYSFAQRPDTKVVDEPLYAHYLTHQTTRAAHPGKAAILDSMESDETQLTQMILQQDYGAKVVVFKQMTHHLALFSRANKVAMLGLNPGQSAFEPICNVLLLRDPRRILTSFAKVVADVTAVDIGVPQQYELYQTLVANGKLTAILDAKKLLLDPAGTLERLCQRLNLPFTTNMLSWPAGPIAEDGVWAKYWYASVHKSTGFKPYVEKPLQLSPELEAIADETLPLYKEMMQSELVC